MMPRYAADAERSAVFGGLAYGFRQLLEGGFHHHNTMSRKDAMAQRLRKKTK
jgi:hypothetical protein